MKAMQEATMNHLPEHVIAAITQAAGIASRRLKHDEGIQIGSATLRVEGIAFAKLQAVEAGGRHPAPEHGQTFKSIMVDAMVEWHTT
ncbi:hypothetical protein [Cupriavidus nantongensis]|uniref:hypothetical protein n=1 Tax=Cupriavidus nantongensis TaxID=1796606 RepID=UPI00358F83CF